MRRENILKKNMEKMVDHFIAKGKVYKLRDWTLSGEQDLYKELVGPRDYKNFVYTASRAFKTKWKTIGQEPAKAPEVHHEPEVHHHHEEEHEAKEESKSPLDFLRSSKSGESSE